MLFLDKFCFHILDQEVDHTVNNTFYPFCFTVLWKQDSSVLDGFKRAEKKISHDYTLFPCPDLFICGMKQQSLDLEVTETEFKSWYCLLLFVWLLHVWISSPIIQREHLGPSSAQSVTVAIITVLAEIAREWNPSWEVVLAGRPVPWVHVAGCLDSLCLPLVPTAPFQVSVCTNRGTKTVKC